MSTTGKKLTAEEIPIPECIKTPAVAEAWNNWLTHMRESGKRPTTVYAKEALAMLSTLPPDGAVACLKRAICLCRTYFDLGDAAVRPANDLEAARRKTQALLGGPHGP